MLGIDDGLINGNLNFADICFLIAAILFAIEFILVIARRPIAVGLTPLGLAFIALGWLVL